MLTRKSVFTLWLAFDLGLPDSRHVRNKYVLFKPPRLWKFSQIATIMKPIFFTDKLKNLNLEFNTLTSPELNFKDIFKSYIFVAPRYDEKMILVIQAVCKTTVIYIPYSWFFYIYMNYFLLIFSLYWLK